MHKVSVPVLEPITRHICLALPVWVRNEFNGRVTLEVQGEQHDIRPVYAGFFRKIAASGKPEAVL